MMKDLQSKIQWFKRVEYPVLKAWEAFRRHRTLIYVSHTYAVSVCPSLHQIVQAKEFYSCKESCTWYQVFEQLQCAACIQEQLSLKPQSYLSNWTFDPSV